MLWLVCLTACASAGANFDAAKVDQLRPGTSTRVDATKALGPPNNETFQADSSVILTWMHSTGTAWGSGRSRYVSILFDKKGRMVRLLQKGSTSVHSNP